MKWRTLDEIVGSVLLQKAAPVHWYMQVLKYAADCLRELQFDTIGVVNTKELKNCGDNSFELPCDYVDDIRMGLQECTRLYPHGYRTSLIYCGSNWTGTGDDRWIWGDVYGLWYGRSRREVDPYTIDARKGTLETHCYREGPVLLEYISDGSDPDNATKVDPYAQSTIEAYCFWKLKAHNRAYGPGEVQDEERKFFAQYRILRGRKNPLTVERAKQIIRNSYGVTLKG